MNTAVTLSGIWISFGPSLGPGAFSSEGQLCFRAGCLILELVLVVRNREPSLICFL